MSAIFWCQFFQFSQLAGSWASPRHSLNSPTSSVSNWLYQAACNDFQQATGTWFSSQFLLISKDYAQIVMIMDTWLICINFTIFQYMSFTFQLCGYNLKLHVLTLHLQKPDLQWQENYTWTTTISFITYLRNYVTLTRINI